MQVTNIRVVPRYGTRVSVIPVPTDSGAMKEASREQLAVLLALMAEPETSYLSLSEKTGATRAQIDEAIAFWEEKGCLTLQKRETPAAVLPPKEDVKPSRPDRAAELPHYNTDEAARFLSRNPDTRFLIDCCQQELGKIFNTSESEIIIGLLDYLSLDSEYILLLCAHFGKKGKRSLRYIEKTAISLHDKGILTYEQLELHLKQQDAAEDAEAALRNMFGIGRRALIKKEKEAFFRWSALWEMPIEVIALAYEIAVARTGEPSVAYTNAILERWHTEGLSSVEAVERYEEAHRPAGKDTPTGASFDTEDFFEAALQRSYKDT